MLQLPSDLSKARILISNDDGIQAEGLGVLEKIARKLSNDVWVVAPETQRKPMCVVEESSACGDRAAGRYRRQ